MNTFELAVVVASVGAGPGFCLVQLQGDLDLGAAGATADQLSSLVDAGCSRITLDMRQVGFCDAAGLQALLRICAAVAEESGWVVIVGACPSLRLMLALLPDMGFPPPQLSDPVPVERGKQDRRPARTS